MARTRAKSAQTVEAEGQAHEVEKRVEVGADRTPVPAKSSGGRRRKLKRKAVIDDAVRLVYERLRSETSPTKETVANLVQLLKIHKEIADEEDAARREVDYAWPGLEDGKSSG